MNEKKFTEKDLVSFGNYLLIEGRNKSIENNSLRGVVNDWDIANWKVSAKLIDVEDYKKILSFYETNKTRAYTQILMDKLMLSAMDDLNSLLDYINKHHDASETREQKEVYNEQNPDYK